MLAEMLEETKELKPRRAKSVLTAYDYADLLLILSYGDVCVKLFELNWCQANRSKTPRKG